ncbi:MAG: hypothetical protein ABH986_03795 [archaeon]
MNKLIEKLESEFPLTQKTDYFLVDVKSTEYPLCLSQVIPLLQKTNSKICVISAARSGEKLLQELKGKKISTQNIMVLSGIKDETLSPNIKCFEPQWKLDSLKEAISFAVKNFLPQVFVFDSVTFLSLLLSKQEISSFISKFTEILKAKGIKGIFINISNETSDDISVMAEGAVDQRLSLEKFLGKKTVSAATAKPSAKPLTEKIVVQTQKQVLDVKELKKSLAQLVREEARKIAEETRKSLETKETEKTEKKKSEKKKNVMGMRKEEEKQKLMKKLELLKKSLELGVISSKAFEEGKSQIMAKLKEK